MEAKQQNKCLKLLLHRLTLKIANCHAILIIIIANIIRFAHFKSKEVITKTNNEDGTIDISTTSVPVDGRFVITTIFVLPPLIVIFLLIEF